MNVESIGKVLSNPIVSQFVGLLVGLFTSFFSWWVLFRWMSPTISLSDAISKTNSKVPISEDDDKSGVRYRFRIENSGRRPAVDLAVKAFVRIKGLVDRQSTIWEVVHLPLVTSGEMIWTTPLMYPYRVSKLRTILQIYVNHTDYCARPHFPPNIREKARCKTLLLEDLLSLGSTAQGSTAQLRIVVSGFDELTGARKVFMKTYHLTDLRDGSFRQDAPPIAEVAPNLEA